MNSEAKTAMVDEWIGDENDGCYVRITETTAYRLEVVVDSDSGGFVDVMGPATIHETMDAAWEAGRDQAIDWCGENDVDWSECAQEPERVGR